MKNFALVVLLAVLVSGLTFSGNSVKRNISEAAILRIGQLYIQQGRSLDSFLQEYPKYFYNSSYKVREQKYEELCYYFKQATGVILYFTLHCIIRN